MNNYKKEFVEIIDYYPSIIKSEIPFIFIILLISYIVFIPFYVIYVWIKKGKPITDYFKTKKKESFNGPEITNATYFKFDGTEIKLPVEKVIKTENTFLYDKDAVNFIKELINSGEFNSIDKLSNKFVIKRKMLTIVSEEEIPFSREIVLACPKPAMILYKFFKPILGENKNGN
jgi:hypothetical protein